MSTLQLSHNVDLEAANNVKDCGGGCGGLGQPCYVSAASKCGSPPLSDSNSEIVENNVNCVNKEKEEPRVSNVSECSVEILHLECGKHETKACLAKTKRDCRICLLSIDATNQDSSEFSIELGCCCKDDLAAAHKQCAEAWFKIKGNKTCEICGSTAENVAGVSETESNEQWDASNDGVPLARTTLPLSEARNFWQGHRFLNFLLACMVFAFVISWLFHFNVAS